MMQEITFGITTFNRPQLLLQLIQSIRIRYPDVRILVADNGDQHASLPDDVMVIRLPFDCGLSSARNALIDHLETEYLLVLEDDFQFTDETVIEPLQRVLESTPDIGAVGGAIRGSDGRVTCYALDIEVCRQTMRIREATHRKEVTSCGIPYRLCDMVWNFALFRREMLLEHRWVDALKIGEHCPYFYEVKLAGQWRIASCSLPKIYHVPDRRPQNYLKYRRRAASYFKAYLAVRGIEHYERVLPYHYEDSPTSVPPVLVLAIGHSGTTVVTRMLQKLRWNLGQPVDNTFAEHIEVRRLNRQVIDKGYLDHDAARCVLSTLPMPWGLKDPRFVQTLHHWLPLFSELDIKPVILRLRRGIEATKQSYRRRGAPGDVTRRLEQLIQSRDQGYDRWPWGRFTLEYEKIAAAVAVFDLDHFQASTANLLHLQALALAERTPSLEQVSEIDSDSRNFVAKAISGDSSVMLSILAQDSSHHVAMQSVKTDSSMELDSSVRDQTVANQSVSLSRRQDETLRQAILVQLRSHRIHPLDESIDGSES